jgi:hypothetical protein
MFENLSIGSGWNVKSHYHSQHLHGIFKSQQKFELEIHPWAVKYFPAAVLDLMKKRFQCLQLAAEKVEGEIFAKAIEDWVQKESRKSCKKNSFFFAIHRG